MKTFLWSVLPLLLISILFNSCKDDTPVENPGSGNQGPAAPVLLSPGNGSTISSLTPALDWEDFPSATSYRVQLSLDANFSGTIMLDTSGITASTVNVRQGLLATNWYNYWRVNANTPSGVSAWSAVWRFNVILDPPPPPVLLLPPNGSNNQSFTPLLDWENTPTAQSYRVQVSESPVFFSNLFDSSRIPVSQVQVPGLVLITGTQYFWRVNASNSGGASTGGWSAVWNFTTISGPIPNSISGHVTFVDTNITHETGIYVAGAFHLWPPAVSPFEKDTLEISLIGNVYQADYRVRRLANGDYRVGVMFEDEINGVSYLMGVYGCDTVHVPYSPCPDNPPYISIINNNGVENRNFLVWADTSKKIF